MSNDRLLFPAPAEERISVVRVPLEVTCPACGADHVARYPIADFIGPRMVTKCQECFHELARDVPTVDDHWPPWRSPTAGWTPSRAG